MRPLDERWFSELRDINVSDLDLKWLTAFMRVTADEKVRFFQNEVENPEFTYAQDGDDEGVIEQYRTLLDAVETHESNKTIRKLYRDKINAQINRVAMLQVSRAGDDQRFFDLSVKLYGKPKNPIFALVAEHVLLLVERPRSNAQEAAAKRLARIFSKIDRSEMALSQDILPPPVEDEGHPLTAVEVAEVFQSVLDRHEINGWSLEVDTTGYRTRFSVLPDHKIINIPNDIHLGSRARPLTQNRALAVAEHEVGVHVRRAFEGEKQRLQLLSAGLQGYLRGEEGLASYVQQQIEGATEYYGLDRYLAISVAIGMDGTKRDFRSVFGVVRDYYTLSFSPKTNEQRIALLAWELTVRIFRGTTGQTPGLVYTRDQVYFEGNVGIWELLIERPHVFEQLFIGKFDPLAAEHVEALRDLDIITDW